MRKTAQVLMDVRGRLGSYGPAMAEDAQTALRRFARELGLDGRHELSLLVTDNPTIRRLNRLWRQMDKPTDVLSFPIHQLKPGAEPPAGPVGDIVISLPYLREAARLEGIDLQYHLAHLVVHGLLHLLGHDHIEDKDSRKMEREERRLLALMFPEPSGVKDAKSAKG